MATSIKIGFCVAYDWYLLQYSLPLIYDNADRICISLDKERISWSGNKFEFDEVGFKNLINSIDKNNKIEIYEDNFHLPELGPMKNEVRQRELMANFLGKNDGWHLQLDSDEYFLNFKGFVAYLQRLNPKRLTNVCCPLIILYKRIDEGFLIVNPLVFDKIEFIQIASQTPHFEHGRRNGYFNHYTDFGILHQSWARSDDEVWQKLNNWGHKNDFNTQEYFDNWRAINSQNYQTIINFHPFKAKEWESLQLLSGQSINQLIEQYKNIDFFSQFKTKLSAKNSIWISRLKKIFS